MELGNIVVKKSFVITSRKDKKSECTWCAQFDVGDVIHLEWKIPRTLNGGVFLTFYKDGVRSNSSYEPKYIHRLDGLFNFEEIS